jgi:hypothetical protein
MRRLAAALACGLWLLAGASPANGWGLDVHRFVTARALDGLPAELKPFFAEQRDFVTEHAADPDLWRLAGLRSALGDEDPNHFFDIDDLGEAPPFGRVPRTREALIGRVGAPRAEKVGRLPWRAEEMFDRLVASFTEIGRPNGPVYGVENARYLTAVLSHYIEDANQPLHATANFDGQLTHQRGVHARYETTLAVRNLTALRLAPVIVRPVADVGAFMFDTIVRSQSRVAFVLKADRDASASHALYDDAYYASFFEHARPLLEQQLSDASNGVASLIVRAWNQAGHPVLPLRSSPRPPFRTGR